MPRIKEDREDIEDFTLGEEPESKGGLGSFFSRDKKPQEKKPQETTPRGHPNKQEVTEFVSLANLPLAMLSPRDAFTPYEVDKLSTALNTYCQTSQRARKLLYSVVKKSAVLALVEVGFMVALPRMIRHGLIPRGVAPYLMQVDAIDKGQLADAAGIELQQQPDGTWLFRQAPDTPDPNRPADIEHVPAA